MHVATLMKANELGYVNEPDVIERLRVQAKAFDETVFDPFDSEPGASN